MEGESIQSGHIRVFLLIIPYFFTAFFFQFVGLLFAKVNSKVIDINEISTQQYLTISFFSCVGTFLLLFFL